MPQPPLRGSQFPPNGGTQLCAGVGLGCDFGDFTAPQLLRAYVGDLDNSGSWTSGDQVALTFAHPLSPSLAFSHLRRDP